MESIDIKLSDNIKIYAAGMLVQKSIKEQMEVDAKNLNFGLEDMASNDIESQCRNDIVNFRIVGQYSYVKGQDIIVGAIIEFSDQIRKNVVLLL